MALRPRRVFSNTIDADDPHVSKIGLPAPAWMVNYADLMTEISILFLVLYAMAGALSKDLQKAQKEIHQTLQEQKIPGEVVIDQDGLRLSLEEGGQTELFTTGSAELAPELRAVLDKLRPTLNRLQEKHQIIVEGHTDNIPIKTSHFASNWELSTARATSVVRMLVDDYKFAPARLAAIGYGEYRPLAPNDTPEGRARNRRVVFLVKAVGLPGKAPRPQPPVP